MTYQTLNVQTNGESFYDITKELKKWCSENLASRSGVLHLFIMHTSCALTINESYDPAARRDMERFMKHLAPRDLAFIEHDDEGEDDSPSHMKSILLNQNLGLVVEKGELVIGTWQGIYLAEFRDAPHNRKVVLKFIEG
ncbi:MAG: YjbQ family protein [Deltaproteobacteria bacterium]|nr:MAG: YjbQ family protein [Deltaproteobacteria bacterium]